MARAWIGLSRTRPGRSSSSTSSRNPEWRYQLIVCVLVLMDKLSKRLGSIASIWAMTVLLGGFLTGLSSYDFWVISALALASSLRLFGSSQERKLNPNTDLKRHVLLKWLFNLVFRRRQVFHISASTTVAGTLDLVMYVLQLSSATVSLAFSVQRLCHSGDFVVATTDGSSVASNQRHAMVLYYSMVLVEAFLFLPAKLCWEVPRDVFVQKEALFRLTIDKNRQNKILNIWDDYFAKVHATARESFARGLDMSLRSFISGALVIDGQGSSIDVHAAILLLDMLYQRDEWIKRKADAEKRARLLPFLVEYIDGKASGHHECFEAAVSLLISLLVTKTNTPEQSRFGPLVLLRAAEGNHPKAVEIMSQDPIRGQVIKYLKDCLNSSNKDELFLALDVLRRLPSQFQQGGIVETMVEQASKSHPRDSKHVNIPALMLWRLCELGHRDKIEESRISQILKELLRRPKIRELEIIVGLKKAGLLQKEEVSLGYFFQQHNFIRCLPEIVEWLSLLEDEARRAQLKRHKKALMTRLQSSGRNRPDVFKLCKLLENDVTVFQDLQPVLMEILNPEEQC